VGPGTRGSVLGHAPDVAIGGGGEVVLLGAAALLLGHKLRPLTIEIPHLPVPAPTAFALVARTESSHTRERAHRRHVKPETAPRR
jgi:hypothetical protein